MTPTRKYACFVLSVSMLTLSFWPATATPTLYQQPFYESPVRGEPDDLLMIPGLGFGLNDRVVYQKLTNTTLPLTPPASPPSGPPTNTTGFAPVVSYYDAPYSLTVRLPIEMDRGASYALWILEGPIQGPYQWSSGIRINDARPLWFSPDKFYRTAILGGLPRQLKVVGRNLGAAPGSVTQVRLKTGSTIRYTLTALDDHSDATALELYAAEVNLPSTMFVGTYNVEVSRDGVSWVPVVNQTFTVSSDPPASPIVPVTSPPSRPCYPNDGADDTQCVLQAIAAAASSTPKGIVVFGSGQYDLGKYATPPLMLDSTNGILLTAGVSLRGALPPNGPTTLMVHEVACPTLAHPDLDGSCDHAYDTFVAGGWGPSAVFTLLGQNSVSSLRFETDEHFGSCQNGLCCQDGSCGSGEISCTKYFCDPNIFRTTLRIGKELNCAVDPWVDPAAVGDITITNNTFAKTFRSIQDGGNPLNHVFLTHNEFGSFDEDIDLTGRYDLPCHDKVKFRIDDSVFNDNVFKPGGSDAPCLVRGIVASSLGAASRVDFTRNEGDGFATDYLDGSRPGFRALYFFYPRAGYEKLLISDNEGTCSGKVSDGEFLSFDAFTNVYGFSEAAGLMTSSSTTVKADHPLLTTEGGLSVQIVAGPGLGQTRPITQIGADGTSSTSPTLTVSPSWDVVPVVGQSKILVMRQFWQTYAIDNKMDETGCPRDNAKQPDGGKVQMLNSMADSVFEANTLIETSGLKFETVYVPDGPSTSRDFQSIYFTEIRGNTVSGEYYPDYTCAWSGIQLWLGGISGIPNAMMDYGVVIARNVINGADGLRGGAITIANSNYRIPAPPTGPPSADLAFGRNNLIFQNSMGQMHVTSSATPPGACMVCQEQQHPMQVGIHLHDYLYQSPVGNLWNTVLYCNRFDDTVLSRVMDDGVQTTDLGCLYPVPPCVEALQVCTVDPCNNDADGNCATPSSTECVVEDTGLTMCQSSETTFETCILGETLHRVTCPCRCGVEQCGGPSGYSYQCMPQ